MATVADKQICKLAQALVYEFRELDQYQVEKFLAYYFTREENRIDSVIQDKIDELQNSPDIEIIDYDMNFDSLTISVNGKSVRVI